MSSSQAERFQKQFEAHVNNQLSKWVGAIPMVMPIFRDLNIVEIVNEHCPGKEEVSHGSWLKLPSALNEAQQQLIELLKFPPPGSFFEYSEALQ